MCVPCWSGNQSPADLRALEQSYKGVLSAFPSKRKWLGGPPAPHMPQAQLVKKQRSPHLLYLWGCSNFMGPKPCVCLINIIRGSAKIKVVEDEQLGKME